MYQGVIKDEERIKVRLAQLEREAELEEQKVRREYLETVQPITNPSGPKPEKSRKNSNEDGGITPVRLEGCKTC
jgi:hypothetical protein